MSKEPRDCADNKTHLTPPQLIMQPEATREHAPATRQFVGIPSLATTTGGRLWAVWYAGITPKEDQNNYVVVARSDDRGATWSEIMAIDPDGRGPVRAFDPEVWLDPTGRLWIFWAQSIGHDGQIAGVWAITTNQPDATEPGWSAPRRLTVGIMMCKPIVTSGGDWLLPVSTWRNTDHSAKVVASTDQGRTWELRGGCNVPVETRSYDEHMLVERRDGTLWMLIRNKAGIGESSSRDGGRSWTPFADAAIAHANARFFIRRLASGNLLMIKHGAISERTERHQLRAFISRDDGQTWLGGLMLDERANVSYPDGDQDQDGIIYIIYDRERTSAREILLARFTEQDVVENGGQAGLRLPVSRGG